MTRIYKFDLGHKGEIWKDIPDWPYHQASSHGRIRALPGALVGNRVIRKTELRILTLRKDGYLIIRKHYLIYMVSWFILSAFTGQVRRPEYVARHLNDITWDNRPSNLVWKYLPIGKIRPRSSGMVKVSADQATRQQLGITEDEMTDTRARQVIEQISGDRNYKAGLSSDKLIIQRYLQD